MTAHHTFKLRWKENGTEKTAKVEIPKKGAAAAAAPGGGAAAAGATAEVDVVITYPAPGGQDGIPEITVTGTVNKDVIVTVSLANLDGGGFIPTNMAFPDTSSGPPYNWSTTFSGLVVGNHRVEADAYYNGYYDHEAVFFEMIN